jgi:hypothetical protein
VVVDFGYMPQTVFVAAPVVERPWYRLLQSLGYNAPDWPMVVVVLALEVVLAVVVYTLEPWNLSVVVGSFLEL